MLECSQTSVRQRQHQGDQGEGTVEGEETGMSRG